MARKANAKPVVKPVSKTAEAAVTVEATKTESVKAEDKAATPAEPDKAEEKKEEAAVANKVTAKKEPVKKETVKKEAAKKETVKKTPAKRETAKKETGRKAASKEQELKAEICVQFADQSLTQERLVEIAKDVWEYDLKQETDALKSLELYVKPEERKVYYVMNKDFTGSFDI